MCPEARDRIITMHDNMCSGQGNLDVKPINCSNSFEHSSHRESFGLAEVESWDMAAAWLTSLFMQSNNIGNLADIFDGEGSLDINWLQQSISKKFFARSAAKGI